MQELIRRSLPLCLVACAPPPPAQLEPQQLIVPGKVTAVIQKATRVTTLAGFTPILSDGDAGTLVTARALASPAQRPHIVCRYPVGSIGEINILATQRITLTAQSRGDSSVVVIRSEVTASWPNLSGTALALTPNSTDCASNGRSEAALVDSLLAAR